MEFRGEYGNSDSLTLKGSQFMHASEKSEQTYKKAYQYFERALEIDPTDPQSNYYIGLMNLLGHGCEQNIEKALHYFNQPGMEKNPRALNAKGYIYFHAPDNFERDPAQLNLFGSIRKDLKQAYINFKKAAHNGSIDAHYNIGSLFLSGERISLP